MLLFCYLYKNENDLLNSSFYIFSMVVEPGANTTAIKSVVKERINGAQIVRQHGKELAFRLPSSESNNFGGKVCYTITSHVMKLVISFRCIYIFCVNAFRVTFQCD